MKRIALVTGGSEGIGFAIARKLAQLGYHTLLTSRSSERAQTAAESLRGEGPLEPHALDVTDGGSIVALAQHLERAHGRLDVLVNNAGVALDKDQLPSQIDFDTVRATFETNFFGAWRMTNAVVPMMKAQRYGRIVNVSSGLGSLTEEVAEDDPAYRTSKAALNMLTRTLAAELSAHGVLVNAACPGWVRTRMGGKNAPRSPEQGADTPVWLATLPEGGPSGGFFRDRKPAAW